MAAQAVFYGNMKWKINREQHQLCGKIICLLLLTSRFIVLLTEKLKLLNKYIITLIILFPVLVFSQETDSLRIDYNYINSVPQNADLFLNDIYIGQTPMHFMWDAKQEGRKITVKLTGYAAFEYIPFTEEIIVNKTFKLIPNNINYIKEIVFKDKSSSFNKPINIIPMALTTAIAAGSAILAYYYKSLAITTMEEYDLTGDPALLDKKKKYDLIGGISLAVLQIGLGTLIYFHFIE